MVEFPLETPEQAIKFIKIWGIEPYWDSIESKAYFRKLRNKNSAKPLAPRQMAKTTAPYLIKLLRLYSKEEVEELRAKLKD